MSIPIVIICYNNYKYIDNTVKQLTAINNDYKDQIIIVDNQSTDIATIDYLKTANVKIIRNHQNVGPWISHDVNRHIYDMLPNKFIITDPDLEFHKDTPKNFVEQLSTLSDSYQTFKIGLALDISEPHKMYKDTYMDTMTIVEWESQFWNDKIHNDTYTLYRAEIDTTFCLINKKNIYRHQIRVANNFTAKHLPWYYDDPFVCFYNIFKVYNNTKLSTMSKLINKHIDREFLKINKRDDIILIKNRSDDQNLYFWKDIYSNWEDHRFTIFDKYLNKDKIFIDIGGWIGTTCIYGSHKSKHVFVVEPEEQAFQDLVTNCKFNSTKITYIKNAVFNEGNKEVLIGKNKFLHNSKLNDSTSHIYIDNIGEGELVKTITMNDILTNYSIDSNEISLIKIDIEGGEEHILSDVYKLHELYKIPIYVAFHYTWWINPDLNRFAFLTTDQKNQIHNDPFIKMLFS
jgi:FkbM family methyltransferase